MQLLLGGFACLFGFIVVVHEMARQSARLVHVHSPADAPLDSTACLFLPWAGSNERAFGILEALWRQCTGMKQLGLFALNIAYVYICGVLLQAWDCVATTDGNSFSAFRLVLHVLPHLRSLTVSRPKQC